MIQPSHHYRTFPSFFAPPRLISVDRPGEVSDAPTAASEAVQKVKREIEEAFASLNVLAVKEFRRTDLTLVGCTTHVHKKIAQWMSQQPFTLWVTQQPYALRYDEICNNSLSEIVKLVFEKVEAHLDLRKKRMAAVKVGKHNPAEPKTYDDEPDIFVDLTIPLEPSSPALFGPPMLPAAAPPQPWGRPVMPTPTTWRGDGGMRQICEQAYPVMKNTMTGYTLTDEEIKALSGLGNYIEQPQEMEEVILTKKIELLLCQIKVLVDVLREWFQNGVLRFEIPDIDFRMGDLETLTLGNYLEVNRTLDDAKILKNFSTALSNLHKRFSLFITYCEAYKDDQDFYEEMTEPSKNKVLGLIEEYNQFLGKFEVKEREVRKINPVLL